MGKFVGVNPHLKATVYNKRHFSAKAPEPCYHSVEDRLAQLAARFSAIEAGLTKLNSGAAAAAAASSSTVTVAAPKAKSTASSANLAPCDKDTPEVAKLRVHCKTLGMLSAVFKWVPSDYYDHSLVWRKDQLGAPNVNFLCKCIVLENTKCKNEDCSDPKNSRYYCAVFQYVERYDSEKVLRFVKGMNEGLGNKQFNFRMANPEISQKMTGFGHNAVVPFGMVENIPVILSSKIVALSPNFFWMGGGHVDAKLRVDTPEFMEIVKPFVADITNPYTAEELANLTGH